MLLLFYYIVFYNTPQSQNILDLNVFNKFFWYRPGYSSSRSSFSKLVPAHLLQCQFWRPQTILLRQLVTLDPTFPGFRDASIKRTGTIKRLTMVVSLLKDDSTALHLAAQNGHNQTARILLFAGCNPNGKNSVSIELTNIVIIIFRHRSACIFSFCKELIWLSWPRCPPYACDASVLWPNLVHRHLK